MLDMIGSLTSAMIERPIRRVAGHWLRPRHAAIFEKLDGRFVIVVALLISF